MTPTAHLRTKTKEEGEQGPNIYICIYAIFLEKQGIQGYQKSHPDQSSGQHFVDKPDQTRPSE